MRLPKWLHTLLRGKRKRATFRTIRMVCRRCGARYCLHLPHGQSSHRRPCPKCHETRRLHQASDC